LDGKTIHVPDLLTDPAVEVRRPRAAAAPRSI
jgi:hypothetical protein